MLPVNEKSTGTADVIHNEALTKHTYHEKGYIKVDFILLFPDQTEVMNSPGTTGGLKNIEKI